MPTAIQIPKMPPELESLVSEPVFNSYTRADSATPAELATLKKLSPNDLFGKTDVRNGDMASASLAGLWLLNNELHSSHDISQSLDTPEGSYWHGIMHRMEGDFGNAMYWLRRAGDHPMIAFLAASDPAMAGFTPTKLVTAAQQHPDEEATHAMAVAEWKTLFGYCYCMATR